MRWAVWCVVCLGLSGPIGAQESPVQETEGQATQSPDRQTLADIRQDLTVLNLEIQRLKTELSTTSGPTVPTGGTVLDRVALIETALQSLTAKTEELEFRIARIVEDGTNRIGDLEFRLVELEGGDLSRLGETSTLGGDLNGPAPSPAPVVPSSGNVAVAEKADFDAAQALLAAGEADQAAAAFLVFTETYPGSPFEAEALIGRGDALVALGDSRDGGRAYLQAYNADPRGATAPEALLKLGDGLSAIDQTDAACTIFAELRASFPESAAAATAQSRASALACP